ncbi:CD151 antigen-like isoform X2 [Stegodyphus dumicola]|nr:CD151 antigen-like isoform X2 [Stegodyphus dumicola]XP_035216778.1 CD151 antigen-like isoform X2 [Stegodyphus dumicola]XP_035216779.1 CD151 antigen-like isoform X2 [Stegodyphus dumicola]
MVEGLAKGVKYALFIANCVILICGIAVFAVGVWTLADRSFMERLLGTDLYVSSASILIATGVIVTIISFLGCFGALKEVKCMLLTFFIILFMIFIVMLVGGILGYVFRNEVEKQMHQEMLTTIPMYKNDTAVTDAWDAVQEYFKCCGLAVNYDQSYEIWRKKNREFTEKRVPVSCCKEKDESSIRNCQFSNDRTNVYTDDCYEKMKDFVKDHALILGGIGIGISCVLIVGMMLSCALFLMIN